MIVDAAGDVLADAAGDVHADGAAVVSDAAGDGAVDGSPADASSDAGSPDAGDALASSCAVITGTDVTFHTTGAYCFVTCDDITGWGCSSFEGRTVKVNGTVVTCAATPLTKVNGRYQFEATAGDHEYAAINWWGTSHACSP